MTEQLRTKMEALRAVAARLNKATDQAAEAIRLADEFLAGLSIGIPTLGESFKEVSNPGIDDDGDGPEEVDFWYLAYDRAYFSDNKFSIHVVKRTEWAEAGANGQGERKVISQSSERWSSLNRADKLNSFEKLPGLLEAIADRAVTYAEEAEKGYTIVCETLEALSPPTDEGTPDTEPPPTGAARMPASLSASLALGTMASLTPRLDEMRGLAARITKITSPAASINNPFEGLAASINNPFEGLAASINNPFEGLAASINSQVARITSPTKELAEAVEKATRPMREMQDAVEKATRPMREMTELTRKALDRVPKTARK